MSLLQVFVLISPLITYPYLVNTLGSELYGWVIMAQVLASYASIAVGFGFNEVTAKEIAMHTDDARKISEIVSSVITIRIGIWLVCLPLYCLIIAAVPAYSEYRWLFLLSFGCTFNELLFPVFYFQGIERMENITWVTLAIRTVSVLGIFAFVNDASDFLMVPLLSSISYIVGGFIALYIIFFRHKIKFRMPSFREVGFYFKDAGTVFMTNVIATFKDKLNYIIMGACLPKSQIVIYDLGSRISGLLVRPASIIATVMFPHISRKLDIKLFKFGLLCCTVCTLALVTICFLLLPQITVFFISENIDTTPVRLYLLAPLFLGVSGFVSYCFLIAYGHVGYIIKSIFVTVCVYALLMVGVWYMGMLNSALSFVAITVLSYLAELIYRIVVSNKIYRHDKVKKAHQADGAQ